MYFTPISEVWGGVGVKISSNRCVCVCVPRTPVCVSLVQNWSWSPTLCPLLEHWVKVDFRYVCWWWWWAVMSWAHVSHTLSYEYFSPISLLLYWVFMVMDMPEWVTGATTSPQPILCLKIWCFQKHRYWNCWDSSSSQLQWVLCQFLEYPSGAVQCIHPMTVMLMLTVAWPRCCCLIFAWEVADNISSDLEWILFERHLISNIGGAII